MNRTTKQSKNSRFYLKFPVIPRHDPGISSQINLEFLKHTPKNADKAILDFSGVLGAAAPKGLGRSPYKICELGLSSLKASKILEFQE